MSIKATDLYIGDSGGNTYISAIDNGVGGTVALYHNTAKKLETTSSGIDVTGNVAVTGTVDGRDVASDGSKLDGIESGATADQTASEILTLIKTVDGAGSGLDADTLDGVSSGSFLRSDAADTKTAGNLTFADNVLAKFGDGGDLQIYHNGSNSYIHDFGTGSLYIDATQLNFRNGAQTATYADFTNGGGARLMHNGNVKFETVGGGVQVTGYVQADSLYLGDNERAYFGVGNDLQIYHDGAHSYVKDAGTGNLYLQGTNLRLGYANGEFAMLADENGSVQILHDNATKLTTNSSGVTVTGTVTADGVSLGDNEKAQFGASNDLQIYHDGSASRIVDAGGGNLILQSDGLGVRINKGTTENMATFDIDGAVTLYYDGAAKFYTNSTGVDIGGDINAVDNIYIASTIYHEGDTDTYTQFHNANEWRVVTGGTEMLEVNNDTVNLGANTVGKVYVSNVSSSLTPNLEAYNSFVITLTGNITLNNPSTELAGMSGYFIFIHSGAGRTVSLGSDWYTAGGAGLTLSSTAGAIDIVPYAVRTTGTILLGTPQLAFA